MKRTETMQMTCRRWVAAAMLCSVIGLPAVSRAQTANAPSGVRATATSGHCFAVILVRKALPPASCPRICSYCGKLASIMTDSKARPPLLMALFT